MKLNRMLGTSLIGDEVSLSYVQIAILFSLFVLLPIYVHAARNTPEALRVDTIADYVEEGLHIVHLKYQYFGDRYIYALSEQERTLKENYDGEVENASLLWVKKEERVKDLMRLHRLFRMDVRRYGKSKFLSSQYLTSVEVSHGTKGELIKVSLESARPLYKHKSRKIDRLIRQMSTHRLYGIMREEPRLYHKEGLVLFKETNNGTQ